MAEPGDIADLSCVNSDGKIHGAGRDSCRHHQAQHSYPVTQVYNEARHLPRKGAPMTYACLSVVIQEVSGSYLLRVWTIFIFPGVAVSHIQDQQPYGSYQRD